MDLAIPFFTRSKIQSLPQSAQLLWQVWHDASVEAGGIIPPRSAIKASSLGTLAANCFVLERKAPYKFTIKMCGSGFETLFGRNLTGEDVTVIAHPGADKLLTAFCENVIARPCAAFARDVVVGKTGERTMSEGFNLPLTDNDGNINQMICVSNITSLGFSGEEKPEDTKVDYRELKAAYFIDLEKE